MKYYKANKRRKYFVAETVTFETLNDDIHFLDSFSTPFYSCDADRRTITAYLGCYYDGPTKFIDFKWTMTPALNHDIYHWLIDQGIIPERCNDAIDHELRLLVESQAGWMNKHFRGWYFEKATNFVDEDRGGRVPIFDEPKIIEIPKLPNEKTISDFNLVPSV